MSRSYVQIGSSLYDSGKKRLLRIEPLKGGKFFLCSHALSLPSFKNVFIIPRTTNPNKYITPCFAAKISICFIGYP